MTEYLKKFYYQLLNYYSVEKLPNEAVDALFFNIAQEGQKSFSESERMDFIKQKNIKLLAVKATTKGIAALSYKDLVIYHQFYEHYLRFIKLEILAKIAPFAPDEYVGEIFEEAIARFVKSILIGEYKGGRPRPYFAYKCRNAAVSLLDIDRKIITDIFPEVIEGDSNDYTKKAGSQTKESYLFAIAKKCKLKEKHTEFLLAVIYYQEHKNSPSLQKYGREDSYLSELFKKNQGAVRKQKADIITKIRKCLGLTPLLCSFFCLVQHFL